jgi:hypothetical protein
MLREDLQAIWLRNFGDQPAGHNHFWERAFSRRRLLASGLATGAALSLPALAPGIAQAKASAVLPNPIKGGTVIGSFPLKHFYFPTIPNPAGVTSNVVSNGTGDPSTIRDFKGTVGLSDFPPTGAVSGDPLGGIFWAADIRFMQGKFVGRDNSQHHGTFAFI